MVQSRTRSGLWALLVLLLGSAAAYGLLVGKSRPEPQSPPELLPPLVQIVGAAPRERALTVHTQGTVRPLREIKLVSQVGGLVESVAPRFAPGAFFSADEMLVKVEDVDYQHAIARAESQVAASQQRLAEEEGRALQARREWRDLQTDKANALFLRKPQIAAAQAALRASEADLAAARLNLARTEIRGPFNGRIIEKLVDLGQYITPGGAVATVYDTDVAQVRLPLTDQQVALLDLPLSYNDESQADFLGAEVELSTRFANREWQWQGRIVRTDASIDESSRVVYAVAEVAKPFARVPGSQRPPLSPGLFVDARISGRQIDAVAELPGSALRNDGNVMIVDEQQIAQLRRVQVLDRSGNKVWVQGLEPGERVIVRGTPRLIEGMPVRLAASTQSTDVES